MGGFAALPHCLLASQVYIGLSAHAVKLLNDLLAQFKGFNNGDLCLAWTIMEKRGWNESVALAPPEALVSRRSSVPSGFIRYSAAEPDWLRLSTPCAKDNHFESGDHVG